MPKSSGKPEDDTPFPACDTLVSRRQPLKGFPDPALLSLFFSTSACYCRTAAYPLLGKGQEGCHLLMVLIILGALSANRQYQVLLLTASIPSCW